MYTLTLYQENVKTTSNSHWDLNEMS